jgi:hypothetical protein
MFSPARRAVNAPASSAMHLRLATRSVAPVLMLAAACGGSDGRDAHERAAAAARATTATPRAGVAEPTATPAARAVPWTRAKVLRRLGGHRVRVDGRAIRLDPGTLTCGGVGAARPGRGGAPAWTRFRCVQPTFPPGEVAGPDLVFTLRPTGRVAFELLERHLTRY